MGHYVLYVDRKPAGHFETLEDAQREGLTHVATAALVHIETLSAPAPSLGWRYDTEKSDWVKSDPPID